MEPVGEPNPSNLNEQKWAQPDDEIRATPWYIELERQAVSIQKNACRAASPLLLPLAPCTSSPLAEFDGLVLDPLSFFSLCSFVAVPAFDTGCRPELIYLRCAAVAHRRKSGCGVWPQKRSGRGETRPIASRSV